MYLHIYTHLQLPLVIHGELVPRPNKDASVCVGVGVKEGGLAVRSL